MLESVVFASRMNIVFTYERLVYGWVLGGMMSVVNVKLVEGTMGVATAGPHAVVVDRSLENDGTYLGMIGGELLFTAVGTCLMTTLVGAARKRNIELTRVEFNVTGEHKSSPSRFVSIDVEAIIEANVSDAEIEKLLTIAERGCTVSNTIARSAPIQIRRRNEQAFD